MLVLVLSNLAMGPAVVLCFVRGGRGHKEGVHVGGSGSDGSGILLVVGTVLCMSATSSMFYHLCDVDAVCVGGLSFESWQIFDVLFSIVSMVFVILYYSPISIEVPGGTGTDWGPGISGAGPIPIPIPGNSYERVTGSGIVTGTGSEAEAETGAPLDMLVPVDADNEVAETTLGVVDGSVSLDADVDADGPILPATHPDKSNTNTLTILSVERGSMCCVSLSLLVLGIIIAPVCNEPTNPVNVVTGLVCSFVLVLLYWCYYFVCVSLGSGLGTGNVDRGVGVTGRSCDCGCECEEECVCSASTGRRRGVGKGKHPTYLSLWRTVLGGVSAVVGMGSFAFQSADGYWVVHSVWHVCMMAAAYFLVSGRDDSVEFIKSAFVRFVASKRVQM